MTKSFNLSQVVDSTGATNVGYTAPFTGAVARTQSSKNAESVSVLDFGADPTGGVASDTAIQIAINSSGNVYIPDGTYLISTGLTFSTNQRITFSQKAYFKAGAANITFFTCSSGYYSQIWNANLNGNGYANVTGFNLTNFRLQAGLMFPYMTNMANGIVLTNCFGATILEPTCYAGVVNPITVGSNNGELQIISPNFDNEAGNGGTGAGTGIYIQSGAIVNEGVAIRGGYIQGFTYGVRDVGIGTLIDGTYFELCSTADVYFNGAINSCARDTKHFTLSGPVAFLGAGNDAVSVWNPIMASGARSTGLFSFDGTNTNCYYWIAGSAASKNMPIGTVTGISRLPTSNSGTFTPTVAGSTTAGTGTYSVQQGFYNQIGNIVQFHATLTWSAHTGTGNTVFLGLPSNLTPTSFTPTKAVQVVPGFAYTGPVVYANLNGTSTNFTLVQVSTAGSASLIPLASSGSLTVSGTYSLN
jgi:hypothetical protein